MAPWNLRLRFMLDLSALVGIGAGAWSLTSGWPRVGRVFDDPTRSDKAPVEVLGAGRLLIEAGLFVAGWWGAMGMGWTTLALAYAVALVVHHATSLSRIGWLIGA